MNTDNICNPTSGSRRRPGRPVQLETDVRKELILDAALRALEKKGLQHASMSAIAIEAGMSKRTVYEMFDSRDVLLGGCIRRIRQSIILPLSELQKQLPLAARLHALMFPITCKAVEEMPMELLRTIIYEARKRPNLASVFLDEGLDAIVDAICIELDRGVARGEIEIDDTQVAACLLHDMAYENLIGKLLRPPVAIYNAKAASERLALALQIFLKGFNAN